MKQTLLILLLLCIFGAKATHIIGGNFNVQQVGRNQFYVDLVIFRDCRTGSPNQNDDPVPLADKLEVKVFDNSDYSNWISFFVHKKKPLRPKLGDDCFEPPNLCVEEYHLSDTITLADNPAGYTIAMQVCCRNSVVKNILNPLTTGMTLTAEIPDPALAGGNSTPQLPPYPTAGFFCLNNLRVLDFSAFDPDGDSLYYELVSPYTSPRGTPLNPVPAVQQPPYNDVTWRPSYSATNAIEGNPGLQIDPFTGQLSVVPTQLGLYVFAYKVSEYRNGQYIGSVRRDIQVKVLNCIINQPPVFRYPQEKNFVAKVNEELCIRVQIADPNPGDSITLQADFEILHTEVEAEDLGLAFVPDTGSAIGRVCWQPSCAETFAEQEVRLELKAYSKGCDKTDTISQSISLKVEPIPMEIESLLPNIFTPNGDEVNDVFRLQDLTAYPCISGLEVRIFNRWGNEVHREELTNLGWDGTYQGQALPEGVYYYIISGSYRSGPFSFKGFVTLVR